MPVADERDWDAFYCEEARGAAVWTGRPNGTLVVEVADLPPGSALDVGCGEGADAVWLAERGWRVTALDPSAVALDRARATASRAGVEVEWVHASFLDASDDLGEFDLVSIQYGVLRRTGDEAAIRALLDAVAPGGTLLVVHHEVPPDHAHDEHEHRFDPADHVMPADVAAHLDDGWEVEVDEVRPRPGPLPPDARHIRDIVLRARRLTDPPG